MKLQRIVLTGQDAQGQPFKVIAHVLPSGLVHRLICDRYAVPYRINHVFNVPVGDMLKFPKSDLGFFVNPHSALFEIFRLPVLSAKIGPGLGGENFSFLMNKFRPNENDARRIGAADTQE